MPYVEVDGLATWHEVRGAGQPVVLLHGAFAGASSWSAQAPALARAGYKVHLPERRPDLVDRLVLIGQYHNSSGKVTGGLTDQLTAGGDQLMGFLRGEYDRVSPDGPEHFPVVYAKTLRMLETELASLTMVEAPTLVLQGDALPNGRLAVLLGTHLLPMENPEVVNALLVWFLGAHSGSRSRTGPGRGWGRQR